MSRDDDIFEAAKAKRAQQKAEEESRSNFSFQEIAYGALVDESYRVFRILGRPASVRKDPTDVKLIEQSMILGDDGKKFRCTWDLDQNWILKRILKFLTDGTWEKPNPEAKSVKKYKYLDRCPKLLNRVLYNNNLDNPYEKGIRPQKVILMNILDRQDMAYHQENNHTKVMAKKATVSDDGSRTYFDRGVPLFLYEKKIWDDVVEYEGNWENYDIVIYKTSDQPFYSAYYGGSDDLRKRLAVNSPELLEVISTQPLTDWEKELERYDLDKIGAVTSYARIFTKMGSFFRAVDQEFKTTYYDELVALKEKEAKERAENQQNETEEEIAQEEAKEEITKTQIVKEEVVEKPVEIEPQEKDPVRETPVRGGTRESVKEEGISEETWKALGDGSYNGKIYKGVPLMTEDEKAQVLSINEDGSFEYVSSWNGEQTVLYREQVSGFESPGTFAICPFTGTKFD